MRNGGCRRLSRTLGLSIFLQSCERVLPFRASLVLDVLCRPLLVLWKGRDTIFFFAAVNEL